MIRNIAILCNDYSAKGKGRLLATKARDILQTLNIKSIIYNNNWPENFNEFTEVWISGGDGTVNYYLNKYNHLDKEVGLLGGGTGNDLFNFLNIQQSLELHIQKLLNMPLRLVDLGYCNELLYINSLGIGFDGVVLKKMDTIRWFGGHLGYLIAVIQVIFSFKEFKFELTFDDNQVEKISPVVLAVSNSRLTGGGFIIAPKANIQDGLLNLMYTEPLSIWKRLIVLPKVEKGKHLNLPYISHRYIKSIKVSCIEEVPYQMDGELLYANSFKIGISDKKLKMKFTKHELNIL